MRVHAVTPHSRPTLNGQPVPWAAPPPKREDTPSIGQFLYRRVIAFDQQQRNAIFSRHPALIDKKV